MREGERERREKRETRGRKKSWRSFFLFLLLCARASAQKKRHITPCARRRSGEREKRQREKEKKCILHRLGQEEKSLSFCVVFNRIYSIARYHTSNECLLNDEDDDDDVSSLTSWKIHRKRTAKNSSVSALFNQRRLGLEQTRETIRVEKQNWRWCHEMTKVFLRS